MTKHSKRDRLSVHPMPSFSISALVGSAGNEDVRLLEAGVGARTSTDESRIVVEAVGVGTADASVDPGISPSRLLAGTTLHPPPLFGS
jgi:hypothetical protein